MFTSLSSYPYRSSRSATVAGRGVVATTQPLAVQAGISMLTQGGNAVDAAIATAIALTVLEPTSNGIGGDAFALVWDGKKLFGLNGSGRSPEKLSLQTLHDAGYEETMVRGGWLSVTVPGAPATWFDLHKRFGKLPFDKLFVPAIYYAENGFPISPILADYWEKAFFFYKELKTAEFQGFSSTFAPRDRAPKAGEFWKSPDHAKTLRRIADSGAKDFYQGLLAETIVRFSEKTGGILSEKDLNSHQSTWVEPISASYRGHQVWEIPPNGQGITTLLALRILEGFDLSAHPRDSEQSFHWQIEALKLAFADTLKYVADPEVVSVPTRGLLDETYLASRRTLIEENALTPAPGTPPKGGTVYLCAADKDGMMVSFIQSNYMAFGSGVVVPGTGIALQNRGSNFSLDPTHPNCVAPNKRPYHTIIPGFLTRDGVGIGPFGVMGGFMQPQGHLQMIVNSIDYHLNPQASLDAPRWQWVEEREVAIEEEANPEIIEGLRKRGHRVNQMKTSGYFGRGQIIWRHPEGSYIAGSDKRGDGYAAGI